MQLKVTAPTRMQTTIVLPSSKSISNRVLIINALSGATNMPENISDCDDTRVMVKALTQDSPVADIMAAGTAMRFLTAYFAATTQTGKTITGTERMQQRPIQILVNALRHLGADIAYAKNEGFPPLIIRGKELTQSKVCLKGNVSSQYISALLMIGPIMKQGLHLTLEGEIISRPYINLTLRLMSDFGAKAYWMNEREIVVESQPYRPIPFAVESDWSAASYWYEIMALTEDPQAEVTLPGLFSDSYQGDSAVAKLFEQLGVCTTFDPQNKCVTLKKGGERTKRMEYDFINQPDLAQTFVVTCALLNIPFRFTGLQSLKIKETDRMAALIREMAKLGYRLTEEEGKTLIWEGERCQPESPVAIDTYEDHRMAMAFAPACLKFCDLHINNPEVVSKSYPHYWENLKKAGFMLEETTR